MGVSGCGKSSVAKKISKNLDVPFLEGDDLHPPENIQKMSSGLPLDDDDRWPWLTLCAEQMNHHHSQGYVITCSALKEAYREHLRKRTDHDYTLVYLKGDQLLIARRLAERAGHFMPTTLLDSQFAALEEPDDGIAISIDDTLDNIVDKILEELTSSSTDPLSH